MPVSFAQLDLHPEISKAVTACGYSQPTPIQAKSIPEILLRRDLVACAQTGTGKTAAFVLPALHQLASQKPTKKTKILILTPTRELADQITKAASTYGKFLRFNIVSLVGGMPYHNQIRDLQRGADIIVATPGRLMDHMEQRRVDLSNIEMLVLDEADRMLDMGFIEDVQYISKLTPSSRQTLLFSATVDKKLGEVVRQLLKNPVRIDLSNDKIASPQITQELYRVQNVHQKTRLLKHFLNDENIFKAIIFSATKMHADKLAGQLRDEGYAAAALHGDLRQNVRNRTIDQLRRGKIQFLVATDVAARGIDINDVTHVFNFDMPKFCEDYVHRIGRTGRAGKTGTAISFVMPTDSKHVQRIEKYIGQRIKLITNINIPENPMTPAQQQKDGGDAPTSFRKSAHDHNDKRDRVARNDKFKDDDNRKPFKKRFANDNNSSESGERKPFKKRFNNDTDSSASGERKPFKKRFNNDTDSSANGERKPFKKRFNNDTDSSASGERKPFKKRFNNETDSSASGERKPFKKRFNNDTNSSASGERKPFKKRFNNDTDSSASGERKPFKKRFNNDTDSSASGERKPFKKRSINDNGSSENGERKPFKKRFTNDTDSSASGERKPFKKRFNNDSNSNSSSDERKSFKKRPAKEASDRKDGDKPFKKRVNKDHVFANRRKDARKKDSA